MMSASHTLNKQKKKGKRASRATPQQTTYIAKIAKKYLGEHTKDKDGAVVKNPNKLTFSKAALTEVDMLINHAIGRIVQNSDAVLTYSGARTFGASAAQTATKLTLDGLLCEKAVKAGTQAIINYNGYDADAPTPANVTLSTSVAVTA